MILVTGTGRCGTQSILDTLVDAGLRGEHEPNADIVSLIAAWWPGGGVSDDEALTWLRRVAWQECASFFLFTPLAPLLDVLFPDATWIWVTRNAEDTVASMLARGWFRRSDDDGWPVVVSYPAGSGKVMSAGPWRCRPNGYTLGAMTFSEWRDLPQAGRCAWWWQWVYDTLRQRNTVRYPVEGQRPDLLCRQLGLQFTSNLLRVSNHHPYPPVLPDGARPWVDRYCSEGMADLYAGWSGQGRRP